ncbi:MAG: DNA-directed RNA polymerase subunit omega [Victivallaceae bacterium]|nr:DNA-directed RNA polymerase subunit omega [Victivallaceae bacterium]
MNNHYLDGAKKMIPDPQILAVVASRRARQLAHGERPMIKCDAENYLDVALLEISEGLLTYEFPALDENGHVDEQAAKFEAMLNRALASEKPTEE